eukprot:scaffold53369_cov58-Cyclotella_meneghiniana.AAC.2
MKQLGTMSTSHKKSHQVHSHCLLSARHLIGIQIEILQTMMAGIVIAKCKGCDRILSSLWRIEERRVNVPMKI